MSERTATPYKEFMTKKIYQQQTTNSLAYCCPRVCGDMLDYKANLQSASCGFNNFLSTFFFQHFYFNIFTSTFYFNIFTSTFFLQHLSCNIFPTTFFLQHFSFNIFTSTFFFQHFSFNVLSNTDIFHVASVMLKRNKSNK